MNNYRCEVCDSYECTCFCECGLPHDQCVCDFEEDDYFICSCGAKYTETDGCCLACGKLPF